MNEPIQHPSWTNLILVLVGLILLLLVGMVGYTILEDWSWFEALYMTFITFSTVGFHEVRQLHPTGQLFTMFIVLTGLVLIALLSASVTSIFVRRELIMNFKSKKMKNKIQRQKNHVILCGAGDTGKTIINEFQIAREPLIVIEQSEEVISSLHEQYPHMLFVAGDATKDEVLLEAGVENARGLISALSEDRDNLFVVISARNLNHGLNIISRSVDQHTAGKMYKAGANNVVSPNLTEGMRMAATVLRPNLVGFLDVMMHDAEFELRMEEVTVPENTSFEGKTLRQIEIPQRTGLIVIAIKKTIGGKAQYIYNPQSDTKIEHGNVLIVLGNREKVERLNAHLVRVEG
ncbi:MAG: potassium channel protein [Deferribacteres bacterium]|nr:potassium channel protein [candidate division KSB1 bacterium]MCB9500544.1 potassium channel protein [Deferribacteres bacterium]